MGWNAERTLKYNYEHRTFRKRYDIDRLELTLENGKIVSGMSVQDRDSYSNCPAGWHAYELRTSDCDDGQICSIERRVVVNWWGCFFTQQEINLSDNYARVVSQNFLG